MVSVEFSGLLSVSLTTCPFSSKCQNNVLIRMSYFIDYCTGIVGTDSRCYQFPTIMYACCFVFCWSIYHPREGVEKRKIRSAIAYSATHYPDCQHEERNVVPSGTYVDVRDTIQYDSVRWFSLICLTNLGICDAREFSSSPSH